MPTPSEGEAETVADASFSSAGATPEGFEISTYTVEDAAAGNAKTLVARTRIAPGGDVETLVVERFADRDALLALHRGMVERALAGRPLR
jgi:hypothetical protein